MSPRYAHAMFFDLPLIRILSLRYQTNMASKYSDVISKNHFDEAVASVLSGGKLEKLSIHQELAIEAFLEGRDVFGCLPTGYGKSIIYQLTVPIAIELNKLTSSVDNRRFPTNPLVIVITPLNSLITDQIVECTNLGIHSCKLESKKGLADLVNYQLVYTSPETLEELQLSLRELEERIIGIFVDESHCVVNWWVPINNNINNNDHKFV